MDRMNKEATKMKNNLIFKWVCIPMAILVILTAGASYNLFAYFQQIGAAQGYGEGTMTTIKYTVLVGYYLGLIPGYIVRAFSPALSFIIAGIMALISFAGLGYITNNGDGSTLYWIFMILFLLIGALSGAIATVAAVVTTVKSFPRLASILIIVIMIAYYKIAPYFEFSMRSAFVSEDVDLMWYFIGVGAVMAIIFFVAAGVIKEVTFAPKIEQIMQANDRAALLIYVFIEILFLGAFYVVALIYENWTVGAWLFIAVVIINFIAVAIVAVIVISSLNQEIRKGSFSFGNADLRDNLSFEQMLGRPKYIALVFASFFAVGITSTYGFNIFQTAFSYDAIDSADHFLDTYWAADVFSRFLGGLISYFFINSFNGYRGAFWSAVVGALGFAFAMLTPVIGSTMLFAATIAIGLSAGMFWVLVPSILMEDAGEKDFGLNWGLTLFANVLGMVFFGEMFDLIYEWQGDGPKCTGGSCVLIQFITFGILLLLAAGLCWYALGQDIEDSKKKKGKKDDKPKKSDRKSKDRASRSKSKDGKSKKDKSRSGSKRSKSGKK